MAVVKELELDSLAVVILPKNLKDLRKTYLDPKTGKIGLTQKQLAAILGVTESAVKKYESETDPSIPQGPVLAKMCILYGTELFFSHKPELRHPALPKLDDAGQDN